LAATGGLLRDYTRVISIRAQAVLISPAFKGGCIMDEGRSTARRTRLPLAAIPELVRPVGLYGTMRHSEVGGAICFGVAVAFATYSR
jgi:hypothetical protein